MHFPSCCSLYPPHSFPPPQFAAVFSPFASFLSGTEDEGFFNHGEPYQPWWPLPLCLRQASQISWCGSQFATVLHHTCRGRGSLPAFPSSPTSFPCPLRWLSQCLVLYKAHAGRTGLRRAGTERDALREAREVSLLRLLPGKLSLFLSIHLIPVCKLFTLLSPTCPCSHPSQTTKKVPCSKALSPT